MWMWQVFLSVRMTVYQRIMHMHGTALSSITKIKAGISNDKHLVTKIATGY